VCGLITSFNIYVSHVKIFTSKRKKIMMGLSAGKLFLFFPMFFYIFKWDFSLKRSTNYCSAFE
jgi:hypothetical protein